MRRCFLFLTAATEPYISDRIKHRTDELLASEGLGSTAAAAARLHPAVRIAPSPAAGGAPLVIVNVRALKGGANLAPPAADGEGDGGADDGDCADDGACSSTHAAAAPAPAPAPAPAGVTAGPSSSAAAPAASSAHEHAAQPPLPPPRPADASSAPPPAQPPPPERAFAWQRGDAEADSQLAQLELLIDLAFAPWRGGDAALARAAIAKAIVRRARPARRALMAVEAPTADSVARSALAERRPPRPYMAPPPPPALPLWRVLEGEPLLQLRRPEMLGGGLAAVHLDLAGVVDGALPG